MNPESNPSPDKAVTWRAFVLGLAISLFLCLTLPYFELWFGGGRAMCGLSYPAVWALLLFLLPISWLLRAIHPAWRFSRGEILFIYSLVSISCLIPTLGLVTHLFPVLTAAGYYGKDQGFFDFADQNSPWWLWPRDPAASKYFYEKVPAGESLPWESWYAPLAAWSLFAIILYVTMAGLVLLLYRQWIQHEHLAFPDLQMPLAATEERAGLPGLPMLSSLPLMVGLGISIIVHSVKGLSFYRSDIFPDIPMVTWVSFSGGLLKDAIGSLWLPFHLAIVGLAFMMPLDVSFSIWFFKVLFLAARVLVTWLGITLVGSSDPTNLYYAWSSGGFLLLAGYYVWRIFKETGFGDSPNRRQLLGPLALTLAGVGGMTAWLVAAGMTTLAALAWVVTFLLGAIVMTRAVSEAGLFNTQVLAEPGPTFAKTLGMAETLGPNNLCVMSFQGYANGGDWGRGLLMPNIMQSLKLAVDGGWPRGRLVFCICIVTALAIPISSYATLTLLNEKGAALASNSTSNWNFNGGNINALKDPANWLEHPIPPETKWVNRAGFAGFAAGTALLLFLRSLFHWLPFHPLGFLLCGGYVSTTMFLSLLVGWFCKFVILRYGGGPAYTRLRPLFNGLILGDFLMMAFWGWIKYLNDGRGYTLGTY